MTKYEVVDKEGMVRYSGSSFNFALEVVGEVIRESEGSGEVRIKYRKE
jgi:hypothetical protein